MGPEQYRSVYDPTFGVAPHRAELRIPDHAVTWAAAQIDRTGIVEVVADLRGEMGCPRGFGDRALLTAMLLAAHYGLGMLIQDFRDVLLRMISEEAREELGVLLSTRHARMSAEDRLYRSVRHRLNTFLEYFDGSVEPRNRRLTEVEYQAERAAKEAAIPAEERALREARLVWALNQILEVSWLNVDPEYRALWTGDLCIDATFLESHARGPSRGRGIHLARRSSDGDAGPYERNPELRMAGDPAKLTNAQKKRSVHGWGLEASILIAGSADPKLVGAFPQLVRAMAPLHKPGVTASQQAIVALTNLRKRGYPAGYLAGDRLYNYALPENFQLPARALGYKLLFDYRDDQLGIKDSWAGAVQVEGRWHCPAIPDPLVDATLDVRTQRIDDPVYRQRIKARRDFELRAKEDLDHEGHQRLMCPAAGPNPRVKCPLKPSSVSAPATAARVIVDDDLLADPPKICTQSSVVFPPAAGAKLAQDLPYGSWEQKMAYDHLRASIEGLNAMVKDGAYEAADDPEKRRVKGKPAQSFIAALLLFSTNIRKLDAFQKYAKGSAGRLVKPRRRRRTVSIEDYRPAPGFWPSD